MMRKLQFLHFPLMSEPSATACRDSVSCQFGAQVSEFIRVAWRSSVVPALGRRKNTGCIGPAATDRQDKVFRWWNEDGINLACMWIQLNLLLKTNNICTFLPPLCYHGLFFSIYASISPNFPSLLFSFFNFPAFSRLD